MVTPRKDEQAQSARRFLDRMSEVLAEIVNAEDPGLKVHMQSRFLRTSHAFASTCGIAQHISMYIDS